MTSLPSLEHHEMLATPGLHQVLAAIAHAGGEVRIVGGAVRNALMGERVGDIDLATTLAPERTLVAAKAAGLKAVPTGIEHGTVTIVSDGHGFEVTTLRHDVETDGRRAKVSFTDDWAADAARRDFTLNALYCDAAGAVYDPLGGYGDVLSRSIRFVGDAAERISEDYLRILRYFRFLAQYGNGPADDAALAACRSLRAGLLQLSRERVGQEMRKLLLAKGAAVAVGLMNSIGVSETLFDCNLDAATLNRIVVLDGVHELSPEYALRLAGCYDGDSAAAAASFSLSKAEERAISAIRDCIPPVPALRDNERKVVLYRIGAGTWRQVVQLEWARSGAAPEDEDWLSLFRLADEWPVPQLPVSGADLLDEGLEPGPKVGEVLRALEDWWMAGGFVATKQELLARVSI